MHKFLPNWSVFSLVLMIEYLTPPPLDASEITVRECQCDYRLGRWLAGLTIFDSEKHPYGQTSKFLLCNPHFI